MFYSELITGDIQCLEAALRVPKNGAQCQSRLKIECKTLEKQTSTSILCVDALNNHTTCERSDQKAVHTLFPAPFDPIFSSVKQVFSSNPSKSI
jgi:hypothetical protein